MEELMEILTDLDPTIDYEHETRLIDGKVLDSFKIVSLVAQISEAFDIHIGPAYLIPENFNSAQAMWAMIQKLSDED